MEGAEFTQPTLTARLEALLFVYGDSLSYKKAAEVLGVTKEEIEKVTTELRTALDARGSGLTVMVHEDTIQLVTKSEHAGLLQQVLKAELSESLTPASLETLAIITYAGPIARAEIDYIRGVNSSYTVRALALRGLIEREADPNRGNSYIYIPSADLIRHLGVSQVAELPDYERLRAVAGKIKPSVAAEPAPTAEAPQVPTL